MAWFLLILGFIPLILGAHGLVMGASAIAKRLRISPLIIGLTIVAFGTSAPELVVNIQGVMRANSAIVMGNVLGSNIFNILFILGIASLITPLPIQKQTVRFEIPMAVLAAVTVMLMGGDQYIDNSVSVIQRSEGLILLLFFLIFLIYNIYQMQAESTAEQDSGPQFHPALSVVLIVAGIVGLVLGGRMIVNNAVIIAERFQVSARIISLTILSIGTSLPELATSVVAALKKDIDIAVGNVVGSNLFNIFFILGFSASLRPVEINQSVPIDMSVHLLASILLFTFIFTGKDRKIEAWEGIILLLLYGGYFSLLLFLPV